MLLDSLKSHFKACSRKFVLLIHLQSGTLQSQLRCVWCVVCVCVCVVYLWHFTASVVWQRLCTVLSLFVRFFFVFVLLVEQTDFALVASSHCGEERKRQAVLFSDPDLNCWKLKRVHKWNCDYIATGACKNWIFFAVDTWTFHLVYL